MCSDMVSFLSVIPSGFSPKESAFSFVPVNQVEQREKINPHNIHEVPVQSANLNRGVIFRRKAAAPSHEDQHSKDPDADNHVQSVHAGHCKIKRKENLHVPGIDFGLRMSRHRFVKTERRSRYVMFYKFLMPLVAFDAKKREAK